VAKLLQVALIASVAMSASAGGPHDGWPGPSPDARFYAPQEMAPYFGESPETQPRRTAPPLPAERLHRGRFQSVQVNVDQYGNNIIGDAANEPSIAIDPTNLQNIVIGWRQFDSVMSDFRQAGWAYSHDGGTTWTFPGVLDPGVFRSDPVLGADNQGIFYFYSLTMTAGPYGSDYTCQLFRSFDSGLSWGGPIAAFGGDKAWTAIDGTPGIGQGNIYCAWDYMGCCDENCFTRSTDGGSTFMYPVPIPSQPYWGGVAVGPDGAVYVVGGHNGSRTFYCARSDSAQDPGVVPAFELSSEFDLGGSLRIGMWGVWDGPNPEGLVGQLGLAADYSPGPTHGFLYALCSVYVADHSADVMFARSVDRGRSWSTPVRVNDDSPGNHAWQWFGTLSVAPNGRLDVVWNDTRNGSDCSWSELFYSYSFDGGRTWRANVPISPSFNSWLGWPEQAKLGDYYQMISDSEGFSLAYAATFNGEQDIYFLHFDEYDCNQNGIVDRDEIGSCPPGDPACADCNNNGFPDECETGWDQDCNGNGTPDLCDIFEVISYDCNFDYIPDECQGGAAEDCNGNGVPDQCELVTGIDPDCNENGILDECDIAVGASADCNGNGVPDECDLAAGASEDCNFNMIPDECDVASGSSEDCNNDNVPDECQLWSGWDCNDNDIVDECEIAAGMSPDCNDNAHPDECDIAPGGGSADCNQNQVPDECDVASGVSADCNDNGLPDECDIHGWWSADCNDNGVPDECDIAAGTSTDLDSDSRPDECEPDCNANGVPDDWDLQSGTSADCNLNLVPDECDIASGISADLDGDGVPDECPSLLGDANCDGLVNAFDIDPFVVALTDASLYASTYPGCNVHNADCNGDGVVNAFDIDPFVRLLVGR
jgi:hypothetical protein